MSVVSDGSYDDYISLTDIAKYRSENPELDGNVRDYTTLQQLIVLSKLLRL